MIYLFTGQPGAGKTTLGKLLLKFLKSPVHIDGDDVRRILKNADYSEAGRRKNIEWANNVAFFLNETGHDVILTMVSPYKDMRDDLKAKTNVTEIFVHTDDIRGRETFFAEDYEPPTEKFIDMDTTGLCVYDAYHKLTGYIFI